MSGVYIRGMEMPQEKKITLTIFPDGRVYENHGERLWGHGEDCIPWKAVPIPPHGDLVDLKAPFKAQYYDEMTEEWAERMVTVEDALYGCMVDEMPPTIIPADPAEEGE